MARQHDPSPHTEFPPQRRGRGLGAQSRSFLLGRGRRCPCCVRPAATLPIAPCIVHIRRPVDQSTLFLFCCPTVSKSPAQYLRHPHPLHRCRHFNTWPVLALLLLSGCRAASRRPARSATSSYWRAMTRAQVNRPDHRRYSNSSSCVFSTASSSTANTPLKNGACEGARLRQLTSRACPVASPTITNSKKSWALALAFGQLPSENFLHRTKCTDLRPTDTHQDRYHWCLPYPPANHRSPPP